MRPMKGWLLILTVSVSLLSNGPSAQGQLFSSGRVVISPGEMVSAGLARAQTAVSDPFGLPQISETEESIAEFQSGISSPFELALVDLLSRLLAFFGNNLLEEAGLPLLFRTDFDTVPDDPDLSGGVEGEDLTDPLDGSELTDPTDTTTDPDANTDPGSTEVPDEGSETTDTDDSRNDPRPREKRQ